MSPIRPSVSRLPNVPALSLASKRLPRASSSSVAQSLSANCGASDQPEEVRRRNAGLVSCATHAPPLTITPALSRREPYAVSCSRAGAYAALPPGACVYRTSRYSPSRWRRASASHPRPRPPANQRCATSPENSVAKSGGVEPPSPTARSSRPPTVRSTASVAVARTEPPPSARPSWPPNRCPAPPPVPGATGAAARPAADQRGPV